MKVLLLTIALLPLSPHKLNSRPKDVPGVPRDPQPAVVAPATQPAAAPKHSSATESVHRGTISTPVEAQGWLEPIDPTEVRIRPKAYAGELTILSVAPNGASVKKGDVLLEIDPAPLNRMLAAAENDAAGARAALMRAEADSKIGEESDALGMKMQVAATEQAQKNVEWFEKLDGPHMLLGSDLAVKNAEAQLDDQQDELSELKKMYKNDDLTTDTADIVVKRAVRRLEMAQVELKIEEERAGKLKTFQYPAAKEHVLDVAKQASQQLELMKTAQAQNQVLRETGLKATHAGAEAADLRVAELKGDLEKLTVRAASDGTVAYGQLVGGGWQGADSKSLRAQEHILPQQVVLTLFTPGKLRLHLDLPETKFFAVHAGAKAAVTPAVLPDLKLDGSCDACPPLVMNTQQGPMYALTVSLPAVDSRLAPGMRASFKVDSVEAENALLVPNAAVADGAVWVKTHDGQCERRAVTPGRSDGKNTEIKQGINEGDEVFVEAQK